MHIAGECATNVFAVWEIRFETKNIFTFLYECSHLVLALFVVQYHFLFLLQYTVVCLCSFFVQPISLKAFRKCLISYCHIVIIFTVFIQRDTSTTMVYCLAEVNTEALLQLLAKDKHKFCQTVIHISSNETLLHEPEVTKINIESTLPKFCSLLWFSR